MCNENTDLPIVRTINLTLTKTKRMNMMGGMVQLAIPKKQSGARIKEDVGIRLFIKTILCREFQINSYKLRP